MDFEYINNNEYGLTEEDVNSIINTTDWDAYQEWWNKNELPSGMQCIEMHMYSTLREFVKHVAEEKNLPTDERELLKMALVVDSMIH